MNVTSVEYDVDNTTITMKWPQQVGVILYYNITGVLPLGLVSLTLSENTSLRLVLKYNTEYNLSVVAVFPCGVNATAVITLYYGNLRYQQCIIIIRPYQVNFLFLGFGGSVFG